MQTENSSEQYDAIIIGAGQSGKPLAQAFAKAGRRTAIIERKDVGGSCINYGCTPTKAMLASAQVAHQSRRAGDYGVETGAVSVDFKAVIARKRRIVEQFRSKIEETFSETDNLTLIRGEAKFTGPKQLLVTSADGTEQRLTAEFIFIDTGTHPQKPDLPGLDNVPWLTSTALMEADSLPEHLLIVGGGYIGIEFSQMFRRFGSEVTIIEKSDQIMEREDEDVVQALTDVLTDEGVRIECGVQINAVRKAGDGSIVLDAEANGKVVQLTGTHLLVVVGQEPNTEALDLPAAGIDTDEKGFIRVNDRLETNQPGVYALGDVKGGPAFTHISYDDYRVVKANLLDGETRTIKGRPVPYTVFTEPQLGRVGLNEKEAKLQGKAVKVAKMPMETVGRAIETGHTEGLMKVIIDAETDQLLGATVLGMEGGELMTLFQVAMMGNLTYPRLRDAIIAHPTLAESLNNVFSKVA